MLLRLVSEESAARMSSAVCVWLMVSSAMVCGSRCDIRPGRRFTVYLSERGASRELGADEARVKLRGHEW